MIGEQRKSILVPTYQNKGISKIEESYNKQVIENNYTCNNASKKKIWVMLERLRMEAILSQKVDKRFREMKTDPNMVFIDLEKACNRIPREVEVILNVIEKSTFKMIYRCD